MQAYKICNRCIMDTTSDPHLRLDSRGVCNYCHKFDAQNKIVNRKPRELEKIVNEIKAAGKGKDYDCVLGLSGGVDSSYMAYLAHDLGLKVLAVHVDAGWNTETAVKNIKQICSKLKFDLHTVVIDWPTMREIQRAFMFSGLANMDVPQDHAFMAAVKFMAHKYKVKYILNGMNLATEGILSSAWQYNTDDFRHIKGVWRKHGREKIDFKKYPHVTFWQQHVYYPRMVRLKVVPLLEYIDYSKRMAIDVLEKEFGWQYYGGKHYESRLTKFIQVEYLVKRYGWDKRRDHLSSLIVGGEMCRDEALEEIKKPIEKSEVIDEDREYILKKLNITDDEWDKILAAPYKTAEDYPSQIKMKKALKYVKKLMIKA